MSILFIQDIIFLCILAACTVTDLKKRIIPNSAVACLFLLGVLRITHIAISGSSSSPHLFAVVVILPSLFAWRNGKIGGGDIKLMMGMGLYLGVWRLAVACVGMLFPCLVYLLFRTIRKSKQQRTPFAPFFLIGSIFSVTTAVF